MSLDQEISTKRAEIRSDGYPMSIGELISLYRDDELDIHPEFQRFYRWSDEQKSRLIESILLGIPIPSIFVSQREDGVWDVIDGLQRLSTILQLVGRLKDESGKIVTPLKLRKTNYLPSLEGKYWEHEDPTKEIGRDNQLIIRRAKIDVKIILRESSESSKYELFQRLNTGGSPLSAQELRNAILTMVNSSAFQWMENLRSDDKFRECIALSDKSMIEQYDLELITRFLIFRRLEARQLKSIGDMGEFLNERIVDLANSEEFEKKKQPEERAFRRTFSLLAASLGERSFRRYDTGKRRHSGGFLISAFEPIALGVGYNVTKYKDDKSVGEIEQKAMELWKNQEFLKRSGAGVRASSRVPANIPLGRRLFRP